MILAHTITTFTLKVRMGAAGDLFFTLTLTPSIHYMFGNSKSDPFQ
jgi:hypothetical protein